MVSPSATLPIIVLFENHWDLAPKQILKDLTPQLSDEGYDTFCLEVPEEWPEEEILTAYQFGLEKSCNLNSQAVALLEQSGMRNIQLCEIKFHELSSLMSVYVSSKAYIKVAERIKALPADKLLGDVFKMASRYSFNIKGIDTNVINEITAVNLPQRGEIISRHETQRIQSFLKI